MFHVSENGPILKDTFRLKNIIILKESWTQFLFQSPGADTGFRKGGGGNPRNCYVLKCGQFACTLATFFSLFMKFGGPQKGGGGGGGEGISCIGLSSWKCKGNVFSMETKVQMIGAIYAYILSLHTKEAQTQAYTMYKPLSDEHKLQCTMYNTHCTLITTPISKEVLCSGSQSTFSFQFR